FYDGTVMDITGGGNFAAATPFATGRSFQGLAIDGHGRLLATDIPHKFLHGDVYDISAGGDFASAPPFASFGLGTGGSALDTVPLPEPSTTVLAALGLVGFAAWRWRRKRRHDRPAMTRAIGSHLSRIQPTPADKCKQCERGDRRPEVRRYGGLCV